jgi:hypothetical protein
VIVLVVLVGSGMMTTVRVLVVVAVPVVALTVVTPPLAIGAEN